MDRVLPEVQEAVVSMLLKPSLSLEYLDKTVMEEMIFVGANNVVEMTMEMILGDPNGS